jgi:hypothetical protein
MMARDALAVGCAGPAAPAIDSFGLEVATHVPEEFADETGF